MTAYTYLLQNTTTDPGWDTLFIYFWNTYTVVKVYWENFMKVLSLIRVFYQNKYFLYELFYLLLHDTRREFL